MKIREYFHEIYATAIAQKVTSGIIFMLACAMCVVTILTVGKSTVAVEKIHEELSRPASRTMTIYRGQHSPSFDPRLIRAFQSLDGAEKVVGISSAKDTFNSVIGRTGTYIPMRAISGDWEIFLTLTGGRIPRHGEALLSDQLAQRAGFESSFGALTDKNMHEYPVVGTYAVEGDFPGADDVGIINDENTALDRIYIRATSSNRLFQLRPYVSAILSDSHYQNARIEMPPDERELSENIRSQFGNYSSWLLIAVLALGGTLIASTVAAGVLTHAKSLGRRRALGASRLTVSILVVASSLLPASVGAIGGILGGVLVALRHMSPPGAQFCFAIFVLTILATFLAALPPALYAAWRDPVLVLHLS